MARDVKSFLRIATDSANPQYPQLSYGMVGIYDGELLAYGADGYRLHADWRVPKQYRAAALIPFKGSWGDVESATNFATRKTQTVLDRIFKVEMFCELAVEVDELRRAVKRLEKHDAGFVRFVYRGGALSVGAWTYGAFATFETEETIPVMTLTTPGQVSFSQAYQPHFWLDALSGFDDAVWLRFADKCAFVGTMGKRAAAMMKLQDTDGIRLPDWAQV